MDYVTHELNSLHAKVASLEKDVAALQEPDMPEEEEPENPLAYFLAELSKSSVPHYVNGLVTVVHNTWERGGICMSLLTVEWDGDWWCGIRLHPADIDGDVVSAFRLISWRVTCESLGWDVFLRVAKRGEDEFQLQGFIRHEKIQ